jgi:hypothetical protein
MKRAWWVPLLLLAVPALARADETTPALFQPDPASVQRYGRAYRFPQGGWVVLHIEGEPYERGYQHGRLLSSEVAAFVRAFAAMMAPHAPAEGWKITRRLTNALFLRRFTPEYLEEMKGIADGASAAGARFDNRPIDVVDIAAVNCWPEIHTLESALEATPTGLEGKVFPHAQPRAMPKPQEMHCSAFAAVGPATADGKIVFGHITMDGLYSSNFYNVWLDVKPSRGHRVLMCSFPGGIQSGMDYYLNDAGLLMVETTITQTRFDIKGMTEASRIREAMQYADNIDKAVEILKKGNNGLYTNEWLLADINTNEIALFELGTHKSRLMRSSKNEWYGNTPGFYWGCNNTKGIELRLETIPGVNARPANLVFEPSDRDILWQRFYHKYKGKIGVAFGKEAFTTPPLAAIHSCDAKFTTTDMARKLQSWCLFGPPLGRTWQPTEEERRLYSEIKPLVSNPWTVLHGEPPAKAEPNLPVAVDLSPDKKKEEAAKNKRERLLFEPAWHGTILPQSDGDVWLASAFAEYERIVAREKELRAKNDDQKLKPEDRDRLAVDLFAYRARYLAAARATADTPLARIRSDLMSDKWYRIAEGKGVLVLNELRKMLGDERFVLAMDSFGRKNAGKPVSTAQFQAHMQKALVARLGFGTVILARPPQGLIEDVVKAHGEYFDYWLNRTGLPTLRVAKVSLRPETTADRRNIGTSSQERTVIGEIIQEQNGHPLQNVDVTLETDKGETTRTISMTGQRTPFELQSPSGSRPQRVIVDKYCTAGRANGGVFSVLSFYREQEHTLIVYGTLDEVPTNREAAEALQKAIRELWSNYSVAIKSDRDVSDAELRNKHLLLIGRPDSNAAGRSAEATLRVAPTLLRVQRAGEVLVLPYNQPAESLVIPAKELVIQIDTRVP